MSAREPLPNQHVPDVVLEELLAAFATPAPGDGGLHGTGDPRDTGDVAYDFDDPSIDRLLGIDTAELDRRVHAAEEPAAPEADAVPPATSATTRLDTPATRRARRAGRKATRHDPGATTSSGETTVGLRPGTAPAAAPAGQVPTVGDPLAATVPTGAKLGRKQRKAARLAGAATAVPTDTSPRSVDGRRTIVIADDDQHMDPIYLDEDAGQRMREVHGSSSPGPSGRATIVIDEFEQHTDAVSALAASSTRIDPRLRARRVAVRRAVGRRRLVWAGIIAAVVLVAVAVVAVLASSLFDVRTIDTQGNVYTDPALIQRVQQEMRGEPILLVDTKKLEHELEAGPWVESARVSTDFPHHVLVDIRERVPQATFSGSDGRYRVIDRDGRVLAVLDGRPVAYMLLTGTAPDSEPGQFAGAAYAAAAQFVIALPAEVRKITTSIAVDTTTNEMTLAIDAPNAAGVTARIGTVNGIEDKLARLLRFVQDGLKPDQHLDVSTVQVGS